MDLGLDRFGLSSFRPGQREILSSVLNQQDVLAVLPTGGGKSLCYQLPAVLTQKMVVVISPLIALMRDQVAALNKIGIPAGCLHSGQTDSEKRELFRQMDLAKEFLLYLSPERTQKEGFRNWIKQRNIALFAIDEAHCVSQWGHDFRPEYAALGLLKEIRPDVPILALTASATPAVISDIAKQLKLTKPVKHVYGFYRPNLYYQVETCGDEELKIQYVRQAIRQTPQGRILIYCGTRKITEEVAATLQTEFSDVEFYHAGMNSEERSEAQTDYETGKTRILVATNAFGMGIDHPDVRLVLHYQMPGNIDSLYQEMGRAGRDGKDSTCLMLYSKKDKGLQSFFIQQSEAPSHIKSARYRNLDALLNYAEGGECRHAEILTYYRDAQRLERCGHCDTCEPQSQRRILKPQPVVALTKTKVKLKKKGASATSGAIENLNEAQENIFQSLRAWRREKAKELDTAAFVIFSDRTLRHLAQEVPLTLEDLQSIHGFGEVKIEKFGPEVLAVIRQF